MSLLLLTTPLLFGGLLLALQVVESRTFSQGATTRVDPTAPSTDGLSPTPQ